MDLSGENGEKDVPIKESFASSTTLRCPERLRLLIHFFPRDNFFVRKCYVELYDDILSWLDEDDQSGVTVTGASGVGTSVFMAYFFLCYQLEYPATTTYILMAYDKSSVLQRAVVWTTDGTTTELKIAKVDVEIRQFRRDPNAIFLLDGPPIKEPVFAHRYVVFTSPNEGWIRNVQEKCGRTMLYMPLWDVAELQTAAEALTLDGAPGEMDEIPDFPRCAYASEVAYRFAVFGGVARPCLATDLAVVASHLQDLQTAVAAVDIMTGKVVVQSDDVKDGKDKMDEKTLSRLLYHCYPSPYVFVPNLKIASPYVAHLLSTRVNNLRGDERERFKHFEYYWFPEAAALHRSQLTMRALSVLERGVHLVAHPLPLGDLTPRCDLTLDIQFDESVMKTVSSQLSPVTVRGPCFIPQSNEFESIDAFYEVKFDGRHGDYDEGDWGDSDIGDREHGDSNSGDSECGDSDIRLSECGDSDSDSDNDRDSDSDSDSDSSGANVAYENHREIDSPPWSGVELIIFQVAGKREPKVDGKELFALLRQLNCTFDAPRRVALVFVVPEGEVANFKRQYVEGAMCLNGSLPLTAVDDITTEMDAILKAAKITCVQDLRQLPALATLNAEQHQVYELAESYLRFHEEMTTTTGSGNHKMLQYIPQFMWGVAV